MGLTRSIRQAPADAVQALRQLVELIKGVLPLVGSDLWVHMVAADSAAKELAEWHDQHAWHDAQAEPPPCYGETVFIGVNDSGYVGAFNLVDAAGQCVYCTAEESVVVMSGLRWWRRHERHTEAPAQQAPDAAAMPEPVDIEAEAQALVAIAAQMGLVLTVEQVPAPGQADGVLQAATVVRVCPAQPVAATGVAP